MVDFRPHYSINNNNNTPSFSSSLLDAIYRSIDSGDAHNDALVMRNNQNFGASAACFPTDEEIANFRRACMIEKWMEKKAADNKPTVRRKSGTDDITINKSRKDRENSSSSSSDSSAGFFSSSDLESFPAAIQRPKPVRTGGSVAAKDVKTGGNFKVNQQRRRGDTEPEVAPEIPKRRDGGFLKTKSRAMKLYIDLKKVKQPISPGGKLAGFLNTLFAGGSPKKPKPADSPSPTKSGSTCSSASSFSRSCLSKTPSSRGKPSTAAAAAVKRSVRFSLVDGDKNSVGSFHQSNKNNITSASNLELQSNNDASIRSVIKEELMAQAMEKNRRVEDAARDLLRNYHRKSCTNNQFQNQVEQLRKPQPQNPVFDRHFEEEEDEDDDLASCASSDLFELDNLSAIGMEELPVYETTHLGTNRAIANGFIL